MATGNTPPVEVLVDGSGYKVVKLNDSCMLLKHPKSAELIDAFSITPSPSNIKLVPMGTILRLTDKRYNYVFWPNGYTVVFGTKYEIKI